MTASPPPESRADRISSVEKVRSALGAARLRAWAAREPLLVAGGRMLRAYSDWLASISWLRFIVLAILFMIGVNLLTDMPFLRVTNGPMKAAEYEVTVDPRGVIAIRQSDRTNTKRDARRVVKTIVNEVKKSPNEANVSIGEQGIVIDAHEGGENKRVTIDRQGVHIETPKGRRDVGTGTAENTAPADAPEPVPVPPPPVPPGDGIPPLPPAPSPVEPVSGSAEVAAKVGADAAHAEAIKKALDEVVDHLETIADEGRAALRKGALGQFLETFGSLFVVFSIIMKIEAGRRVKSEVAAAEATELAEDEQLKRQLVEARLQAMQAQVEPHFLFNTLASIDHLIETDPARASAMQKNLITYLRGALPKMRENTTTLGREVDLIRAYLDILKVRMDERLQTEFAVPEGLRSADFPPMMLQSIVENAIKHGLEPKPEGGLIRVAAEIVDGHLRVTVTDTGLGFDPERASTRGTGLGLANIRERLALLHDGQGRLSIAPNVPSGTAVAIELPYAVGKP